MPILLVVGAMNRAMNGSDGSVVSWGHNSYGADSSAVSSEISSNVTKVVSSQYAFAALKSDGSVVSWGNSTYGGDSSSVAADISANVDEVYANDRSFADEILLRVEFKYLAWIQETEPLWTEVHRFGFMTGSHQP